MSGPALSGLGRTSSSDDATVLMIFIVGRKTVARQTADGVLLSRTVW